MHSATYQTRRDELRQYFDRTAADAWARLTSDAPVSRIRATVRAGRDSMRRTLLSWLPEDLSGVRLLDAGCGTGMLSIEAAQRGADVVAIDLSPTLVELAAQRASGMSLAGRIDFRVGDMSDASLGDFDHVVAMDSLIHYRAEDMVAAAGRLAALARHSVVFTFAPRTPLLTVMHGMGRFFPRGDRAPAIEPVDSQTLNRLLHTALVPGGWHTGRSLRVANGFYISQGLELHRRGAQA
jgi:magnesium-protoporphyrin O-methyltransferase